MSSLAKMKHDRCKTTVKVQTDRKKKDFYQQTRDIGLYSIKLRALMYSVCASCILVCTLGMCSAHSVRRRCTYFADTDTKQLIRITQLVSINLDSKLDNMAGKLTLLKVLSILNQKKRNKILGLVNLQPTQVPAMSSDCPLDQLVETQIQSPSRMKLRDQDFFCHIKRIQRMGRINNSARFLMLNHQPNS